MTRNPPSILVDLAAALTEARRERDAHSPYTMPTLPDPVAMANRDLAYRRASRKVNSLLAHYERALDEELAREAGEIAPVTATHTAA